VTSTRDGTSVLPFLVSRLVCFASSTSRVFLSVLDFINEVF
jgi:hypothetical protein